MLSTLPSHVHCSAADIVAACPAASNTEVLLQTLTWWTLRIFSIFFLLGEGERGVRPAGRGGGSIFKLKIPGGGSPGGGGAEGPGGSLRRIGELRGCGLNIFFRG